jgi:hypothetical protein
MYSELSGPQTGLLASYHMNDASGSGTATDASGNNNHATLTNTNNATVWGTSTAPFADATAATQTAPAGMWAVVPSATSGGLTVANSTFLQDVGDDVVFGHDGGTSNTAADTPTTGVWATAPKPSRFGRVWYCDLNDQGANGGSLDFTFNFATAGVSPFTPGGPASNYRLLERAGTSGTFSDIATATSVSGSTVTFAGVSSGTVCSYITLGSLDNNASPTPITLSAFTVRAGAGGNILNWSTSTEIGSLGFQIYRSEGSDRAAAQQITAELIAAQGDGVTGGSYIWTDATALPGKGYTYWLREIRGGGSGEDAGSVTLGASVQATTWRVFLPLTLNP